jgi:hypothetical protein
MYRVVYVSSAVEPFSEEELSELLNTSRRNNHKSGITGMLLYDGGNFMQILEGPKPEVTAVLAKIHGDSRHRGLITLMEEDGVDGEFQQWSMGFNRLDRRESCEEGENDFLRTPLDSREFQVSPSKSLRLLLSFRKVIGSH